MPAKRIIKVSTILLAALILASNTAAAETIARASDKIDLKLNLQKGQKFGSLITMDQKISQTVSNQPMDMKQKMTMGMAAEVLDVNSSNIAKVKMTYELLRIKLEGPTGLIEFDSNEPAKEPNNPHVKMITGIYQAMVGQNFITDLTSKGKIVKIEGFDKMMDDMVSKISKEDPNMAGAVKDVMKIFMSEERLKEMNNNMIANFPDEPAGIGDMWYDTISLGSGFPIDLSVTYILKDRKNGVAVVDSISKMDMGDKDSVLMKMHGQQVNVQFSGTMSGTNEIDESTGWLIKSNAAQKFAGAIKISASQQMPAEMIIPMTMESTITIEPFVLK